MKIVFAILCIAGIAIPYYYIFKFIEANIFVEVYKGLPDDIFSLIIHDCILTTKEKTPMVKTLLMNRVKELYKGVIKEETNLDNFFKVDKVSKNMPDYYNPSVK